MLVSERRAVVVVVGTADGVTDGVVNAVGVVDAVPVCVDVAVCVHVGVTV